MVVDVLLLTFRVTPSLVVADVSETEAQNSVRQKRLRKTRFGKGPFVVVHGSRHD